MKMSILGSSGLSVSRVCLGTMTWGEQNDERDAHDQMDYAVSRGVNFFDTAELYPVPISAKTVHATETFIGNWFQKTGKRDQIILASKVCGEGISWIRDGGPLNGKSVIEAIEGSLRRLQTDYIDLYQLHWPNRSIPHFGKNLPGKVNFDDVSTAEETDGMLDILRALDTCVQQGKIRFAGLSNDTAWGIMTYLQLAKDHALPRMVSVQNEFSLLDLSDDPYVAEVCVRENLAYLPWSPLATGFLSGKYANHALPEGSRWHVEKTKNMPSGSWRGNEIAHAAVAEYLNIAKTHGLDVCQMALKFCDMQPFVTSTIIGATTMEQLKTNIDAFDIALSSEVMNDIHRVIAKYPIPF